MRQVPLPSGRRAGALLSSGRSEATSWAGFGIGTPAQPGEPTSAAAGEGGQFPEGDWPAAASGSTVALALSGLLVWVAQFHHFRDLGLYEDDYFFISEAMGQDVSYVLDRLHTAVTVLPQGRPLGFFLPDLLSFVGDKLGGLAAIYLLGFVLVTLNTFLCYRLLRVRVPVAPAAVGAAVFCLFPADTTKILLTHDFQLQPSLTFALLAALAYTPVGAGRWPISSPPGRCCRMRTATWRCSRCRCSCGAGIARCRARCWSMLLR